MPVFLPWLAILALLALKGNRCASAWWIWAPLLCVGGALLVPQSLLSFLPSSQFEMFFQWVGALGFGMAAVWLLAGLLAGGHRFLAFLAMLGIQEAFIVVTFLCVHGQDSDTPEMLIPLALTGFVTVAALSVAGGRCRGRYGWLRLSLWLIAVVTITWALVITPFFIFAYFSSGGRVPLMAFVGGNLVVILITLGVMLPFMVLAFVNGFYRERLKGLLHLEAEGPPVIPPSPPMAEAAPGATNAVPRV